MTDTPIYDNPDIVAVLAASDAVEALIVTRDLDGFAALHAPEFIVNSPANRVIDGKTAARAFAAGMIDYSSFERRVEHAGKLPNGMVVIMGEEVLVPRGSAPNAGKTVRRRFTDLWRDDAGAWKLSVRQATIIDVSETTEAS